MKYESEIFDCDSFQDGIISIEDIKQTIGPFLGRNILQSEWLELSNTKIQQLRRQILKQKLLAWLPRIVRDQKSIEFNYNLQWEKLPVEIQTEINGLQIPLEWGDLRFMGRAVATKRVHLLYLIKLIKKLAPKSVLEVGSGNGLNLIGLATQFSDISLTGLELTSSGVDASNRIANKITLPQSILDFIPLPLQRLNIAETIDFYKGNACNMPFEDSSFDLVYTALALEQMEEVRNSALTEISRVANKWVIMIEPFRDFNDSGIQKLYIDANHYFSAKISDLSQYGLKPLCIIDNIPNKIFMKIAIVLAIKQ